MLSQDVGTRVELRQVGARDEARLTADYEKCGQYCCCKNFLKVLKPVSMKNAKVQKATLDPLKISGRCGRLMCCLRYEEDTYEDLRKNLPRKKSRVGTPDGDGTVLDGQILTQLVLVLLDAPDKDGKIHQVAVPVEDLTPPKSLTPPPPPPLPTQPYSRAPEPRRDPGPPRDQNAARDPAPRDQPPRDQGQRDQGARDQGPPRDRGPRRDGPPGGPRSGPPARPPERRPPPPQAPPPTPRPPARDDAIDLDDIETDFGDGPPAQGASGPPGTSGPQGADDANRRRRRGHRRRGGPPPGAQGQGGPGGPGPGSTRPV